MDVSFLDQLQHLQQLLLKKQEAANEATTTTATGTTVTGVTLQQSSSVKFDKKLLDFDYGEEEDDEVQVASQASAGAATSPKISAQQVMSAQHSVMTAASNNLESLGLLLANPEVIKVSWNKQYSLLCSVVGVSCL